MPRNETEAEVKSPDPEASSTNDSTEEDNSADTTHFPLVLMPTGDDLEAVAAGSVLSTILTLPRADLRHALLPGRPLLPEPRGLRDLAATSSGQLSAGPHADPHSDRRSRASRSLCPARRHRRVQEAGGIDREFLDALPCHRRAWNAASRLRLLATGDVHPPDELANIMAELWLRLEKAGRIDSQELAQVTSLDPEPLDDGGLGPEPN